MKNNKKYLCTKEHCIPLGEKIITADGEPALKVKKSGDSIYDIITLSAILREFGINNIVFNNDNN